MDIFIHIINIIIIFQLGYFYDDITLYNIFI